MCACVTAQVQNLRRHDPSWFISLNGDPSDSTGWVESHSRREVAARSEGNGLLTQVTAVTQLSTGRG